MSTSTVKISKKSIQEWQKLAKDIYGIGNYLPMWLRYGLGQEADKYADYVKSDWLGRTIGEHSGNTRQWLGAYGRKGKIAKDSPGYANRDKRGRVVPDVWVSIHPGAKHPRGMGPHDAGTTQNFHGIWAKEGQIVRKTPNKSVWKNGRKWQVSDYSWHVPMGKDFMVPSFMAYGAMRFRTAADDAVEKGIKWLFDHVNQEVVSEND